MDTETLALLQGYEEEVLQLVDNADSYTRSDLQGIVEAIIRKAFEAGKDNA